MATSNPTIIVGWDGSAASRAAMAAAARLARGGRLIAVHAHEATAPHVTTRWQELLALDAAERSAALLGEIPHAAIDGLVDVHVEASSLEGPPAEALLRAGREHAADAIAVGSRGIGASPSDTGSVSSELLRTSDRPVLVIPPAAVRPSHGS